jgi:hypothetical protein
VATERERQDLIRFLAATPQKLKARFEEIGPAGLDKSIEGGWTPQQIAGHLKDSIVLFEQRVNRMLNEDEPPIQSWNQDESIAGYAGIPVDTFFSEIEGARRRTVEILAGLDDARWQRAGLHSDPSWGRITIEWLAGHIRDHETEHLAELARAS